MRSAIVLRVLIALSAVGFWFGSAHAATIELARRVDGTPIVGVRVEGDIVPGDALKLLAIYELYSDAAASTLYLRSKGGDVEEAMKMGRLIRTLRLETEVPHRYDNEIESLVPAANKDNFVCASACFLVFAGGVNRSGNFLVLHRPYLTNQAVKNLSDAGREAAQKQVMTKIRDYLQEMEVDNFFIDKMMWTSSQDAYVTTLADVLGHHLNEIVPSVEEIILRSCDVLTQRERDSFNNKTTDPQLREQLGAKHISGLTCESNQLDILRSKAWDRQHENDLQLKCGQLSVREQQFLIAFFKKPPDQRSPAEKQAMMPLFEKQQALGDCKARLLLNISMAALTRYRDANREAAEKQAAATLTPRREDEDRDNPFAQFGPKPRPEAPPVDATGLSPEEMVKKGEGAVNAKNYAAAMLWYRKAADLGSSHAMLDISYLYAGGRGVAQDDAEAMRWRRKAADLGDRDAMSSVGADYEYGWGVAQNYTEAMRWYRKAADLGDAGAMLSIGGLYDSGHGVAQDYAEAIRWHRKAANLGNTLAMYMIGMYYEYGTGVPANDAEARLWLKKAAGLGDLAANRWLADHP